MQPPSPRGVWAWVVGAAAFLVGMALLAAIFSLGPFKEKDLMHGELIARGDEICREAHQAFLDLQRRPPGTASEAADLAGRLADIAAEEADELQGLNGPAELEAAIDEYAAAREEGIAALRAGQKAASERDAAAYAANQAELADGQRERHLIARRIGFAVCSRPLPGET